MERIPVPGWPGTVSRLGFGCIGLTSLNDRQAALRLLERAYDEGVTHFDVARLYGSGQAEGILGEFLRGKRDRVTVMTKFGKEPPRIAAGGGGVAAKVKGLVKWGMQRSGVVKRLVSGAANKATVRGKYDPASALASLETSLREMKTDYVDFLALHDCAADDAQRADTLGFLQEQVSRGRVRTFGFTVNGAVAAEADLSRVSGHSCVMFPSNALEPVVDRTKVAAGSVVFTCRPVKYAAALAEAARKSGGAVGNVAGRLGVDPTDASALAGLMLRDAVRRNGGVVVFSTTRAERVAANVRAALGPASADEGVALAELVAKFGPAVKR